jgi:predicted nucleic acid-binding Zn ribbon protein
MQSLGKAIRGLVKEYGLEETIRAGDAINLWSEVVGSRIAKNCSAVHIRGKTLYVKAKNAAWRNEIAMQREPILEEINNKIGRKLLEDISIQ